MSKFDEILNSSNPSDALLGEQIDKMATDLSYKPSRTIISELGTVTGCTVNELKISYIGDLVCLNGKVTFSVNISTGSQFNCSITLPEKAIEPTMTIVPAWSSDVSKRYSVQCSISNNVLAFFNLTGNPDTTNGSARFQIMFRYK